VAPSVYKYRIDLSGKDKQLLRQAKKKGRKDARLVIRILMTLLANKGKTISETAETLGCCEQTVLNQRKRFLACRAEGPVQALQDRPRSGRPVTYGPAQRTRITAVVCETFWKHEAPLSRFSIADLRRVVQQEEDLTQLSHSSLGRFLRQDALKPWRYRYWLFPRDPDFVARACVILDLYAGFWEGQQLGAADYVLSADEKSIQVLARLHPGLPPAPGQVQRVEFEYKRWGTVAYHAAWDVFRGQRFGRVAPTTSIATFAELIDLVMGQAPYRTAERVFWIVDGGSAHHRNTFPARVAEPVRECRGRLVAGPCQLVEPDRTLLLHRAAQSPDAVGRGERGNLDAATARFSRLPPGTGPAFFLEVHNGRSEEAAGGGPGVQPASRLYPKNF
jgi:hypothetical protein